MSQNRGHKDHDQCRRQFSAERVGAGSRDLLLVSSATPSPLPGSPTHLIPNPLGIQPQLGQTAAHHDRDEQLVPLLHFAFRQSVARDVGDGEGEDDSYEDERGDSGEVDRRG